MAVVARLDMEHNPWKGTNKGKDWAHQHFYWCPWVTYWISVSICVKGITIVSTSQACQDFKWNNKRKALSTRCLSYGQSPINVGCCHCCYHGNDEKGRPMQSPGLSLQYWFLPKVLREPVRPRPLCWRKQNCVSPCNTHVLNVTAPVWSSFLQEAFPDQPAGPGSLLFELSQHVASELPI